jgi:hypothetical protein
MVQGTRREKGISMPGSGRRTLEALLAALVATLCAPPGASGQAPDQPVQLPTADVTVVYQFDKVPMNGPHKLTVTYAEAGQRVRTDLFRWIEAKSPYRSTIFDRPANRLITVEPESRSYTQYGIGSAANPGEFIKPELHFKREGTATIAHAKCTEWVVDAVGKTNDGDTACVSDDGVVLRLSSKNPSVASLTATDVHYGAPPDGEFDPPAGYRNRTPH